MVQQLAFRDNRTMEPSPSPWYYAEFIYGLRHCLIDRDGRVIGSHFPTGNGPTMAAAPAMVALLRELAVGTPPETLRRRAESILREIDRGVAREPGEDEE
jgi:hypothetical protein